MLSTQREEYDRGQVKTEGASASDDWRQYEQTFKSAGVEDNVYSWSVFWAILAMPLLVVGNYAWR